MIPNLLSPNKGILVPITVIIVILLVSNAGAGLEVGAPFIRNFRATEYGGSAQIWSIEEDIRGVMYFGTSLGILEYDGQFWRKIVVGNRTVVRSMAAGPDGRVYVGGIGEIGFLAPNRSGLMTFHSLKGHVPDKYRDFKDIWDTKHTSHGIYFFGEHTTFRWHQGTVQVLPVGDNVIAQREDDLFLHTDEGICQISGTEKKCDPKTFFDPIKFGLIWLFPSPRKNELLVSSSERGLHRFPIPTGQFADTKAEIEYFQNDSNAYLVHHGIRSSALLNNGTVAFGTRTGGIVVQNARGNLVQFINEKRGLAANYVLSLKTDRFGNLWAGTNQGISLIHMHSPFTYFHKSAGLKSTVYSITRHQGEIYAGAFSEGPMKLAPFALGLDGDIPHFEILKGPVVRYGWHFLSVGNTLLLAGEVVRRIHKDRVQDIPDSPSSFYMCQSKRFSGRIYLGNTSTEQGGVSLLHYQTKNKENPLGHGEVTFTYRGKLPGIHEIIKQITEDQDGGLWLSTRYSGLVYVTFRSEDPHDVKIVRYTTKHGLPKMSLNRVYLDGTSVLVATEEGLYRFVPPSHPGDQSTHFVPEFRLDAEPGPDDDETFFRIEHMVLYGKSKWVVLPVQKYGFVEKLPDNTYQLESRPFRGIKGKTRWAHIDDDGVIWLLNDGAISRYDPAVSKDYDAPFGTMIRNAKTNKDRQLFYGTHFDPTSQKGDLYYRTGFAQDKQNIPTQTYNENGMHFEFSALFYEHSEQNQFQYKLHGYDEEWSDWSTKNRKEYTNLSEGNYNFVVRAKNLYGTVGNPASYRFKILPPWYRTILAYIGYFLCMIILMASAIRLNSRRLLAAKKRLEQTVKERTAEVMENKSEIEQQRDQLETAYHQVKETKEALWGEMELAKKIQTVLLPGDPTIPGYEITGYLQSADEVGGDYYDVINGKEKDWLAIGDVSGHGVPSGLVMMMVRSIIHYAIDIDPNATPETILTTINRTIFQIIDQLGVAKYMPMTLLSVSSKGDIEYAGLHEEILIYRVKSRTVEVVETRGFWLGVLEHVEGMNYLDRFHLAPGDTLLLFTDGILEAGDKKVEMYGINRLTAAFQCSGEMSTTEIRDTILQSIDGFDPEDDVTLLIVKRTANS